MRCDIVRMGDRTSCAVCGLSWDTNDPAPPECLLHTSGRRSSSGANERQVAGTHYSRFGELQHWDVVHAFKLDYFQGQITKYVMRWNLKHGETAKGIEDLEKAQHFLQKYIELKRNAIGMAHAVSMADPAEPSSAYVDQDR